MKNIYSIFFLFLFTNSQLIAQKNYLFTYFVGNGEDGLHLAYSTDGLNWTALNKGKSVLTPEIGKDKLMRDPCVIKGADGRFHMVWTSGWQDQIIGYASTNDMINWSEQKQIPVMSHEPTSKNAWAPEIFYDNKRKKYLILWASTIPGKFNSIQESEKEKGWNHKMYFYRNY